MNTCHLCSRSFSRKWNLIRHVTHFHSTAEVSNEEQAGAGWNISSSFNRPQIASEQNHPYDMEPPERENKTSSECMQWSDADHRTQTGGGSRPLKDYLGDGEDTSEDEMSAGGSETSRPKEDMLSREESDSENDYASPGESDDVDSSSSEDSSEDGDSDAIQDGGLDAEDADGVAGACDNGEDDGSSRDSYPGYMNFARWGGPVYGLLGRWVSRHKKPFIVQHRGWLKKLVAPFAKSQKLLIKEASDSQLDALREIAANLVCGESLVPARIFPDFVKRKHTIKKIASEHSSYTALRRILKMESDPTLSFLLQYATPTCIKSRRVVFRQDSSSD